MTVARPVQFTDAHLFPEVVQTERKHRPRSAPVAYRVRNGRAECLHPTKGWRRA
jgi:hypothetical protein